MTDFAFGGEVTKRPREAPTQRELNEYNYFRRNVAGVQREWWWEFREDFSLTTNAAGSHGWKFGAASVRGPNKDDSASNLMGTWQFASDQAFNPNDPASIASLICTGFGATIPAQNRCSWRW